MDQIYQNAQELEIFIREYLLRRAPEFRKDFEKEDAWAAVQDAKAMFKMAQRAGEIDANEKRHAALQAQAEYMKMAASLGPVGMTGATGPIGMTYAAPPTHPAPKARTKF